MRMVEKIDKVPGNRMTKWKDYPIHYLLLARTWPAICPQHSFGLQSAYARSFRRYAVFSWQVATFALRNRQLESGCVVEYVEVLRF